MEYRQKMPEDWSKTFKSRKFKDKISEGMLWFLKPDPNSKEGRKILEKNELLFRYCDTLDDVDYAFEPLDYDRFILIPDSVQRQGIGFCANPFLGGIEMDVYFFPCDYSEDESRDLGPGAVSVPVLTLTKFALADPIIRKYFPGDTHSAVIPFSYDRYAELEGYFIDDYEKTAAICRKAVENGTGLEAKKCREFLEFIRTVGKR